MRLVLVGHGMRGTTTTHPPWNTAKIVSARRQDHLNPYQFTLIQSAFASPTLNDLCPLLATSSPSRCQTRSARTSPASCCICIYYARSRRGTCRATHGWIGHREPPHRCSRTCSWGVARNTGSRRRGRSRGGEHGVTKGGAMVWRCRRSWARMRGMSVLYDSPKLHHLIAQALQHLYESNEHSYNHSVQHFSRLHREAPPNPRQFIPQDHLLFERSFFLCPVAVGSFIIRVAR